MSVETYPQGPMHRPFHLLRPDCVVPGELSVKIYLLCVITLSMLSLLFLFSRLLRARYAAHGTIFLWRRWRRKGGGETGREGETAYFTVADLFSHLMVLLCVYEICYSICDYVYVLDCYTPIGHSVSGTPYEDMLTQNNYALGAAREFFAGQTLFLHGSIAYCMHAVMVRKLPALELYRKPRVILMTLGSLLYLAGRAALTFALRSDLVGYRIGRLFLTDLLLIPLCLSCIAWWYLGVMRALRSPTATATAGAATAEEGGRERGGGRRRSKGGNHGSQASSGGSGEGVMLVVREKQVEEGREASRTVRHESSPAPPPLTTTTSSVVTLSAPFSSSASISASSSSSSTPPRPPTRAPSRRLSTSSIGGSRGQPIQPALNQQLLKRLTFILYVIVGVWTTVIITDLIVWFRHLLHLPHRPALLLVRSTVLCSLGLFDALILGLDLSDGCCPFFSRSSSSSSSSTSSSFSSWLCPWWGWLRNRAGGEGEEGGKEEDLESGGGARQGGKKGGRGGGGGERGAGVLARPVIIRMNSYPTVNSLSSLSREKSVTFSPSAYLPLNSSTPEEEALVIVAAAEAAVLAKHQQQQHQQQQHHQVPVSSATRSGTSSGTSSDVLPPPPLSTTKTLRLFISTYNMGGVNLDDPSTLLSLQASLPRFLPLDLDLYAIGVQECTCLTSLRLVLHRYLGGPSAYSLFHDQIGDAVVLHGYVGLIIFVKAADVTAGAFSLHHSTRTRLATGKEVMGGWLRIPNKGVVGLSARYFDTTLAFVTAHFASDKQGKNRLRRRNRDARVMLRRLGLVWGGEGAAVDVHHLHHHTFFCGDANYRCLTSPRDLLNRVALSARLSQARLLLPPPLPPAAEEGKEEGQEGAPDGSTSGIGSRKLNWREVQYARLLQGGKEGGTEGGEAEGEGEAATPLYPPYCPSSVPLNGVAVSLIGTRREGGRGGGGEEGREGRLGATLRRLFKSRTFSSSSSSGSRVRGESSSNSNSNSHSSISAGSRSHIQSESGGAGGEGAGGNKVEKEEGKAVNGRQQLSHAGSGYTSQFGEEDGNIDLEAPLPPTFQNPPLETSTTSSASASSSLPASSADCIPLVPPSNRSALTSVSMLSTSSSLASSTFSSSSSPWAWVPTLDELHLSRQQRLVFWGWREGKIAFPPSYRWHRQKKRGKEGGKEGGGLAGDFTSVERLMTRAYTTRTTAKPPTAPVVVGPTSPSPSPPPTPPSLPLFTRSSFSLVRASSTSAAAAPPSLPLLLPFASILEGNPRPCDVQDEAEAPLRPDEEDEDEEEDEEEDEAELKKDARVIRTPSYTDRVLSHSLPGQGQLLRLLDYDMHDEIELSDHRPVVATYALTVDGGVRGFRSSSVNGRKRGEEEGEDEEEEEDEQDEQDDLAVFTFTFRRPQVEFFVPPGAGEEGEERERARSKKAGGGGGGTSLVLPSPHSVTFLFPLVPEDPAAEERLASALGEALPSAPFLTPPRVTSLSSSLSSTLRERGRSGSNSHLDCSGGGSIGSSSGHGRSATWGRSRKLTASARRDVRWGGKGFPVRFETVASLKFSQHMLIRLSDVQGRDLGECVVPVSVALFDEEVEEERGMGGGKKKEQSRSIRLPLTMGGQFQGWLCLDVRVTTSPL